MTLVVRAAGEADVAAIAELDTSSFLLVPWSAVMVHEGVAGIVPGLSYLVAEDDDAFAGYAAVSVVDDVAELQRIAVPQSARKLGVGAALVAAAAAHARAAGAVRLLLEVHEDNHPALALYSATGFVEIARRARYFRDGSAALVLERSLREEGWTA
ncbi:ribosomal-protein-alanine N-acetyltransferase [Nocardioides thalensis]|uniref:Ribosomal-protein-alanine N-acetyltransferase n=1 Tax=Nocardioides thalensis TaxID=1914755 RepID=A0A853C5A8_9ACTN|nr:ribosomal-protein-alanine N-acetyltransferase [Nocardioides thalensis]